MQKRHSDRQQYFQEQATTTKKYIIPFIEEILPITKNISVLEIGCSEAGNLMSFLDMGCKVTGVDLSESKIKSAHELFESHINRPNLNLICSDIYEVNNLGQFDLIILRNTLEHIHNQEKFLILVKKFLKPTGIFFLGFPPWQNPFGGHQQMCKSRFLSKLPYFHILPTPIYKSILKLFGEKEAKIEGLLEIKETGITIERFEKIIKKHNYKIDKKTFYFINPDYETKYNLKPRKQLKLISSIPFLRNFTITTNYYLISIKENS